MRLAQRQLERGTLALCALTTALTACGSSSGCSRLTVTVAAAPTIAPVIESAARRFDIGNPCASVTVTAQSSADIADVLSGQGAKPETVRPDAWVPDSSLWIAVARRTQAGAAATRPSGTPIALSPLVLAAPRGRLPKTASWRSLLADKPRVRFLDPATEATGLGALLLARRVAGHGTTGLAGFAAALYADSTATLPSDHAAFTEMFRHGGPVVLSEQAVWRHNRTAPRQPATALYPRDAALALDFPYVSTATDPGRARIVEDFRTALTQSQTRQGLQDVGLRTPDGIAGATFTARYGVAARATGLAPREEPRTIEQVLQMWQRTVLGARMIVLLDVSGSMAQPVVTKAADSRMRVSALLATQGMRIFGDTSQMGLWQFASGLNGVLPYRVVVPVRDLGSRIDGLSQRTLLARTYAATAPVPGTGSDLTDSILAAYRQAVATYRPNRNNVVVVLTDEAGGGLARLPAALRRITDPERPVAIVPIGIGADVPLRPLRRIARLTGGEAFTADDPARVRQVFLAMLIKVTCGDSCPIT